MSRKRRIRAFDESETRGVLGIGGGVPGRRSKPDQAGSAVKHFPKSWGKALRAAGLDPDQHKMPRGPWDEPAAASWVQERLGKRQSILARDVPLDLSHFVWRRLGKGWADFVGALGIAYPGLKKRRDWTEVKLVAEIRRWTAAGNPLNYRAVADNYQALIHQARKFFGSWDRARAAAGV